jgi:hypothetical protein
MPEFNKEKIAEIAAALGAKKVSEDSESFRIRVGAEDSNERLSLVIYPKTLLGKKRGALVVAYAHGAHLQLHNCSAYVISEELGEVTFVTENDGQLSGLVVERSGFCSLYAALNRELITGDFTQLGVEAMLSGVALSLAESVIDDGADKIE